MCVCVRVCVKTTKLKGLLLEMKNPKLAQKITNCLGVKYVLMKGMPARRLMIFVARKD